MRAEVKGRAPAIAMCVRAVLCVRVLWQYKCREVLDTQVPMRPDNSQCCKQAGATRTSSAANNLTTSGSVKGLHL